MQTCALIGLKDEECLDSYFCNLNIELLEMMTVEICDTLRKNERILGRLNKV